MQRDWPAPYLQPNPREGGDLCATAYVARCLGFPDADDDGVLRMDPLYGFKRETWAWFLGPGAGIHNQCHRIEMWPPLPKEVSPCPLES